jgi:hypothetical protein
MFTQPPRSRSLECQPPIFFTSSSQDLCLCSLGVGPRCDQSLTQGDRLLLGGGGRRGQAEGLFGQQSPLAWGYLQGSAMGMNPGLAQGSEADKVKFYQGARNQGFNDQTIRSAANQMMGNQNQGDWSYLQNRSGYGGGGYGNQYMPQMQTPFSYQPMQQQMQTPFSYPQQSYQQSYQPSYPTQLPQYVYDTISDLDQYRSQPVSQPVVPQRTSSGPSQAIVGRSSQMRGTPNVMRRAEGGIASLMDDEE